MDRGESVSDINEATFDVGEEANYSLSNWRSARINYASDMDRSTLSNYKKSIDYICKTVKSQFPKKIKGNKVTEDMISASSPDTNPGFESEVKYNNKTLTRRKSVGKVPGLPDTTLVSGVDEDKSDIGVDGVDQVYVMMVTRGQVVSMFFIDPQVYFGGPDDDSDDMPWNI